MVPIDRIPKEVQNHEPFHGSAERRAWRRGDELKQWNFQAVSLTHISLAGWYFHVDPAMALQALPVRAASSGVAGVFPLRKRRGSEGQYCCIF